jgi:hypothetical protein
VNQNPFQELLPLDTFTFYAVDGKTGEASASGATCSIYVTPGNHVPVARSFEASVSAGTASVIEFANMSAATFQNAFITRFVPCMNNNNMHCAVERESNLCVCSCVLLLLCLSNLATRSILPHIHSQH